MRSMRKSQVLLYFSTARWSSQIPAELELFGQIPTYLQSFIQIGSSVSKKIANKQTNMHRRMEMTWNNAELCVWNGDLVTELMNSQPYVVTGVDKSNTRIQFSSHVWISHAISELF